MRIIFTIVVGVALVVTGGNASAGYITMFEDGKTMTTEGLTGYGTTGDDMVGMGVSVLFADGTAENLFWNTADQGVKGTGWSLTLGSFASSTWTSNYWTLEAETTLSSSIVSLLLDGSTGKTIFDLDFQKAIGTAGSSVGDTFNPRGWLSNLYNVTATYSNIVAVGSNDPVGDLYSKLFVEFTDTGLAPDFYSARSYNFYADTDSALTQLTVAPVPEPATMLLFGTGLAGLAASTRRKKK